MFLSNALVVHCGGIARRDYGTGLTLFFSACGMGHGCGVWILLFLMLYFNQFYFILKKNRHRPAAAPPSTPRAAAAAAAAPVVAAATAAVGHRPPIAESTRARARARGHQTTAEYKWLGVRVAVDAPEGC